MNTNLVTVIIPVYNTENYLSKCIESVISQTHTNLQILLINDGSTDKSAYICDEYAKKDSRITVIHKSNTGVSDARNEGLKNADGNFITFVDSDDYIEPEYIETLIKYDADVVVAHPYYEGYLNIYELINKLTELDGFKGPCEKLYRKNAIEGILFKSGIRIGEDILFNLEVLSLIKNVQYIKYCGYKIRNNPDSVTRKLKGSYTPLLDIEYQNWWCDTIEKARNKIGLTNEDFNYNNKHSVKMYQMIQNLCFDDCPYSFGEKLRRIKFILHDNRKIIKQADKPTSKKTYYIIRLCLLLHHPIFSYCIFRILNTKNKNHNNS